MSEQELGVKTEVDMLGFFDLKKRVQGEGRSGGAERDPPSLRSFGP